MPRTRAEAMTLSPHLFGARGICSLRAACVHCCTLAAQSQGVRAESFKLHLLSEFGRRGASERSESTARTISFDVSRCAPPPSAKQTSCMCNGHASAGTLPAPPACLLPEPLGAAKRGLCVGGRGARLHRPPGGGGGHLHGSSEGARPPQGLELVPSPPLGASCLPLTDASPCSQVPLCSSRRSPMAAARRRGSLGSAL